MDLLDAIVLGFRAALGGAFQALHAYSVPLLAVLAAIYLAQTWRMALVSGGNVGDALATSVNMIVRIGIFFWGLVNLWVLANAALQTFVQWGAEAGGGPFTVADFLHPSRIWALGWVIVAPIDAFIQKHSGVVQIIGNAPDLIMYGIAKMLIIVAFWLASLTVLMTILEFFFAVAVAAVLIPWGILSDTVSLAEFALSWLIGGCIRSLLTALVMAIGTPMLQNLPIPLTAGGDPTLFGSWVVVAAAGILAVLVWQVPKRAAMVAGRGMALAMGGDVITQGAVTGFRATVQGMSYVTGVSRLVLARI